MLSAIIYLILGACAGFVICGILAISREESREPQPTYFQKLSNQNVRLTIALEQIEKIIQNTISQETVKNENNPSQ